MELVDAAMDASFWINLERVGLLRYLREFFRLWVPPAVATELTAAVDSSAATGPGEFVSWVERGDIRVAMPTVTYGRFDAGENQAIALAIEHHWVLLIDDAQPRHYSLGPLDLRVVDSPAFVVLLYARGFIDHDEAAHVLGRSGAARRIRQEAMVALELLKRRKEGH